MNVGSLFSGIGGIDLGLERAGMHVAWQCEVDPWCQRILAKHWPSVPRYGDIRSIGVDAPHVDVLAGGFPCQPVSLAGKGLAQRDERWLWPEFARLVRVLRPRYVLVENVPGLLTRGMGDVLGDLAACGYDAEWDRIGADDVGAPHRRKRVWIVAYPTRIRSEGLPDASRIRLEGRQQAGAVARTARGGCEVSDADGWGCEKLGEPEPARIESARGRQPDRLREDGWQHDTAPHVPDTEGSAEQARLCESEPRIFGRRRPSDLDRTGDAWIAEPDVGRVAHGIPTRVDRLRGLGNAVVPQVVEWIGRRIVEDARDRAE